MRRFLMLLNIPAHISGMNDHTARKRQPRGTTTGGQFATEPKSDASVTLQPARSPEHYASVASGYSQHLVECIENRSHSEAGQRNFFAQRAPGVDAHPIIADQGFVLSNAHSALRTGLGNPADHHAAIARSEGQIAAYLEREERWKNHPTFVEPRNVRHGAPHATPFIGTKYQGQISNKELKSNVSKDVQEAISSGYLRDDLEYKVSVTGQGVQMVKIEVRGLRDFERLTPNVELMQLHERDVLSASTLQTRERITNIADAYAKVERAESQYENTISNYFTVVDVEAEYARDLRMSN